MTHEEWIRNNIAENEEYNTGVDLNEIPDDPDNPSDPYLDDE